MTIFCSNFRQYCENVLTNSQIADIIIVQIETMQILLYIDYHKIMNFAKVLRGGSMAIELFAHNQEAYESAVAMLGETGKACVIHPTGTGKSFIGFKLCEDNPEKKVLWLAPSEYIFDTQIENLKKAANGYTPENIEFCTYARLMNMTDDEISALRPGITIYDEYHRAGAACWSTGVERLEKLCPDMQVLGLSATNIRYLDNQRDMAKELFDGNIASEMSLGEAIALGILNPPKYILSIFSYQKELEKYEQKIRKTQSRIVRDAATEYLNALRRTLEKADGLDVIFDKHMEDRTGKYILFCANYETMKECIEHTSEWFSKVDAAPKIYSVYSGDPSTSKDYADFVSDKDCAHLRLLFCIDALNEGIHVDDISGVILFRPTVSPIIYKQQIGRALSANKKKIPVIFDIVNNIDNLYSIDSVKEEMQAAITYYRYFGNGHDIVTENFQVIDEVADCRYLFEKLEETLNASWDLMYEEAKQYFYEHGDLLPDKYYRTSSGYSLGLWVATQRRNRNGAKEGTLDEERIKKLDAIGMQWDSVNDRSWARHFEAYKDYIENGGDLRFPSDFIYNGVNIGKWLTMLRKYESSGIRSNYFTPERKKALEDVGVIWDRFDFVWEQNYQAALSYYLEHGNLEVPSRCIYKGVKLYNWLSDMRKAYRGYTKSRHSSLTEIQVQRMNEIGMRWDSQGDLKWEKGFEEARKYSETHGAADAPFSYVTSDGYKLGLFLSKCREKYVKGTLNQERIDRLNSINMVWNKSRANEWDTCFNLVRQYYEQHGDIKIPPNYKADGIWLSKWLNEQRQIIEGKRKGKTLTEEQLGKLESVGFTVEKLSETIWDKKFWEIKNKYTQNGHARIPVKTESQYGGNLYTWYNNQLQFYKKGKMRTDRVELFRSILN